MRILFYFIRKESKVIICCDLVKIFAINAQYDTIHIIYRFFNNIQAIAIALGRVLVKTLWQLKNAHCKLFIFQLFLGIERKSDGIF